MPEDLSLDEMNPFTERSGPEGEAPPPPRPAAPVENALHAIEALEDDLELAGEVERLPL